MHPAQPRPHTEGHKYHQRDSKAHATLLQHLAVILHCCPHCGSVCSFQGTQGLQIRIAHGLVADLGSHGFVIINGEPLIVLGHPALHPQVAHVALCPVLSLGRPVRHARRIQLQEQML